MRNDGTKLKTRKNDIETVKEEKADEFKEDIYEIMKNVITLNVPLDVHISQGSNMSELK